MHILILGAPQLEAEFRQKFAQGHELVFQPGYEDLPRHAATAAVVFDFLLASQPASLHLYREQARLTVFCHALTTTLAALLQGGGFVPDFSLLGFNGWPGMVSRPLLEVSAWDAKQQSHLARVCQDLGTGYVLVDDRVGLVTPRVLAMIINEAYYTCQEGTAAAADIDLAMKLGMHFPLGPFEWAEKIGIGQVYQLLEAVYADTHDERYKACPALKKASLRAARFT